MDIYWYSLQYRGDPPARVDLERGNRTGGDAARAVAHRSAARENRQLFRAGCIVTNRHDTPSPRNRRKFRAVDLDLTRATTQRLSRTAIRLTDERLSHILRHPEMVGLEEDIERALATPDSVVESVSDTETQLYLETRSSSRRT